MSTPTPQPNRRGSIRKKPKGKVQIECRKGVTGLGSNLALMIWDISQTGACLVAQSGLDVHDEVELLISSIGSPRKIKIHATVVWLEPLDPQRVSMGVRFHKPLTYLDMQQFT